VLGTQYPENGCEWPCGKCTTSTSCTTCVETHYLSTTTNTCEAKKDYEEIEGRVCAEYNDCSSQCEYFTCKEKQGTEDKNYIFNWENERSNYGKCEEKEGIDYCKQYELIDNDFDRYYHCAKCKDNTYSYNYVKNGRKVTVCQPCAGLEEKSKLHCKSFTNAECNVCKECEGGYINVNGACQAPIPNCMEYGVSGGDVVCTSCKSSYLLSSTGKCIKLGTISHCANYVNETLCSKCEDNYIVQFYPDNYLKSIVQNNLYAEYSTHVESSVCVPNENIEHCNNSSKIEPTLCNGCDEGYGLDYERFKCQSGEVEHCLEYTYFDYCKKCEDGYYLKLGKCYECTEESLDISFSCNLCNPQYLPISKDPLGKCYDTHCLNNREDIEVIENVCNPNSKVKYCLQCESGYILNSNKLTDCIKEENNPVKGCVKYNKDGDDKECIFCTTGYYLKHKETVGSDGKHFECAKCPDNCLHCTELKCLKEK